MLERRTILRMEAVTDNVRQISLIVTLLKTPYVKLG